MWPLESTLALFKISCPSCECRYMPASLNAWLPSLHLPGIDSSQTWNWMPIFWCGKKGTDCWSKPFPHLIRLPTASNARHKMCNAVPHPSLSMIVFMDSFYGGQNQLRDPVAVRICALVCSYRTLDFLLYSIMAYGQRERCRLFVVSSVSSFLSFCSFSKFPNELEVLCTYAANRGQQFLGRLKRTIKYAKSLENVKRGL